MALNHDDESRRRQTGGHHAFRMDAREFYQQNDSCCADPCGLSRAERPSRSASATEMKILSLVLATFAAGSSFADWPQFRGPGALGRGEGRGVPLHWSDTSNLVWKAPLPGPGASSPITVGNRIFITCHT